MSNQSTFSQIELGLEDVFEEIRTLEPIFHTQNFGVSVAEFDRRMSSDYWEAGASGSRYSRAFILDQSEKIASVKATSADWSTSEFGFKKLGPQTFLFTYTLNQNGRFTRRATIWQKTAEGWQILYHQGTIISSAEDDSLPT